MKKFLKLLTLLAALACLPWTARAGNAMWHADGMAVRDGQGRTVHITGFNLGNWLLLEGWMFDGAFLGSESRMLDRIAELSGPGAARDFLARYQDLFITEDDIALIARAGFNTLRLPINYRALVTDAGCLACDGQGWRHIDQLLGWSRKHGLHVILDMHAVPGAQAGLFTADTTLGKAGYWGSHADQDRLVAIWTELARRYHADETVAGYDLINEPDAPSGAELVATYRTLIAAIRSADPDHMIWLEGNKMASDLSVFAEPLGANIGYSAHMYTFPRDTRRQRLEQATQAAQRLQAPVWIGEMGQSDDAVTAESVRRVDAAPGVVGWSYWTWKRGAVQTPAPCLLAWPAAWKSVAPWLTDGVLRARPAQRAAAQGTEEMLRYLQQTRCRPEPGIMAALGAKP